jgi:hypothetical protein
MRFIARSASALALASLPVLSLTFLSPSALAQPANRFGATSDAGAAQRTFSEFSYVAPSPLSLDSTAFGDVDTLSARVSHQATFRFSDTWSALAGVDLHGTWFDVPGNAPIPDRLYETSIRVGAVWRMNDRWTVQGLLSPGLYSDFEDIDGGDFNVPGLLLAFWQVNDRLQLIAGAGVNVRRDLPVIPAIGGRWRFAEDWTLLAVFPTPRIEYSASDALTVFAGAELVRSAYRVAEDFGTRFGRPELNDQDMSYNEWRVGAGARWSVHRAVTLSLDAGWMGDREFNFDDREFDLSSDGAPYVQFSISATY